MEDELLEIADRPASDAVDVQTRRLMVDTRKWIMAKRAPRKYGDRIHQEIEAGNATEAVPVIYIRSSAAPSDP